MGSYLTMLLQLLLPLLISPIASSKDECDAFKQEQCPFLPGNIVGTISDSQSPQICQKECQEKSSCSFFSHFTFPDEVSECYLFKTCDESTPCDDCLSGPAFPDMPDSCVGDCTLFQNGRCDLNFDNILDIMEPVHSSENCQAACRTAQSCTMFSYDHRSFICFLFSLCNEIDSCDTCITGPPYPDVTACEVTTSSPTPMPGGTLAVALGGASRRDGINFWLGSTEIFSRDKTCSIHIQEMDDWSGMVMEFINGKVMACGGYDRTKGGHINGCWVLDLENRVWELLEGKLAHVVQNAKSLAFRSTMLIFGGEYSGVRNWVQEYVVGNDTWHYRSDLYPPESKDQHCVVNVDDELIFMFGGRTSISLDSAHVLNYTSGKWTELPSMHDARHDHTCLLWNMNGQRGILVIGGQCTGGNCDVVGPLRSVEFFDFEKIRWTTLYDSYLQDPRYFHGMSVLDGVPVVYGGYANTTEILTSGERLEGETWVKIDGLLSSSRAQFGYADIPADFINC